MRATIVSAIRKAVSVLAPLVLVATLAACQGSPQPPGSIGQRPTPVAVTGPETDPSRVTFAFEPFTGAPGNIADDLSEDIGAEARRQGLTLVRRVGAAATYRINGYLSATGDRSSATVFYVFDIVDNSGRRVKRVSGTETTSGSQGDPWEAVDSATLSRIANRSVVEISAWLNRG
ncbi:MAG: hypothetical protein JJ902_13945 [Roseibium sp.]|nr:hypothetical protein [Roseibium sp.]